MAVRVLSVLRCRIVLVALVLTAFGCVCFLSPVSAAPTASKHRALLIGNYSYGDGAPLLGVAGDVSRMEHVLAKSSYASGEKQYRSIMRLTNLTGEQMLTAIDEAFGGATSTDVSFFFFGGHGGIDDLSGQACLCGIDAASGGYIRADKLEQALRRVPGTKVVVLDCCFSGGFISKRSGNAKNIAALFNDAVLAAFTVQPKSLSQPRYKVLTACNADESSWEVFDNELGDRAGEFTSSFVKGAGYLGGDYLADTNRDNIVTLDEMYRYTQAEVELSSVQVFPHGDSFALVSKQKDITAPNYTEFPLDAAMGTHVDLNKGWEITFNKALNTGTVNSSNIYIRDGSGNIVNAAVKMPDNKTVHLIPSKPYKPQELHNIYITPQVRAADSGHLRTGVLATFYTCAEEIGLLAPSNVSIGEITDSTVQLYWDPVDGADYYHVYESLTKEGPFSPLLAENGSKAQVDWWPGYCVCIYGLTPDTTVYFRVTAVKDGVESEPSDTVWAATLSDKKGLCLKIVQAGTFDQHPYPSVWVAFESFFAYPMWDYFISIEGNHVVEFNGFCWYGDEWVKVTIQFLVYPDTNRFEICFAARDDWPMFQYELTELLNAVYDKSRGELPASCWRAPKTEQPPIVQTREVTPPALGKIMLQDKKVSRGQ